MTLIGYWPLNEENGGVAYDHSGNGYNGSVNGSLSTSSGILGDTAYSFDGSNGNNVETTSFDPYTNNEITFCGWIKASTDYTSPSTNKWFMNHYGDSDNRFGGFIGTSGNMKAYLKLSGTVYSAEMSGNPLNDGKWKFIVIKSEGNQISLWVNGVKRSTGSKSGDLSGIGSGKLYINEFKDDDEYNYELNADYCEIRAYNRALTASEIQYIYSISQKGSLSTSRKRS